MGEFDLASHPTQNHAQTTAWLTPQNHSFTLLVQVTYNVWFILRVTLINITSSYYLLKDLAASAIWKIMIGMNFSDLRNVHGTG